MNQKEKIINEVASDETGLKACPKCGDPGVWRVQRNESEKTVYYLTKGLYAVKKYMCKNCGAYSLLHSANARTSTTAGLGEDQLITGFITCAECGNRQFRLSDEPTKNNPIGKRQVLRKAKCVTCNTEIAIDKEDFESSFKNEPW
jgi:predicted RNA-binding Zn-ribbon protein involved in translation (DUF1610 family)